MTQETYMCYFRCCFQSMPRNCVGAGVERHKGDENQLVGSPLAYLNGEKKNLNVSDLYELHILRNRFSRFT